MTDLYRSMREAYMVKIARPASPNLSLTASLFVLSPLLSAKRESENSKSFNVQQTAMNASSNEL